MNKRIEKLIEQCTVQEFSDCTGGFETFDKEKFAQLIVKECIDIASQEDFDVMMKEGYPCSQTAKKIREHFGVEE